METTVANPTGTSTLQPAPATQKNALTNVNLDDFLKLLITELQNQDPLNPTDNDKILEQISQIRSIESTSKLSDTLDAVRLGQSLASASTLIDRQIRALADDGSEVNGKVERVSVNDGIPKLIVGGKTVTMSNLREILALSETAAPPAAEVEPPGQTTPAAQTYSTADVNHDGVVNPIDLYNVLTNWGQAGASAAAGDANGDGKVDIFDVNLVSSKWGTTGSTSGSTATP
jgi:flagellar basal-body rod modification protein FlgD